MIETPHRKIPQTMGTQHPDNANAPYWETDGDGYVSIHEEVRECASSFQDLGCEEYMWDWEGKYVDEGVIEKLLTEYHAFFSKHHIGRDRFLTFRIPNIWEEKGRSLARAFMNILTAEEFARDLGLHTPPLFEMILPMADDAKKMIYLQKTFTELAKMKHKLFKESHRDFHYVQMIPLIEGVHSMETVNTLLDRYVAEHKKQYKRKPEYMRVFLARSDPALISGVVPAVLANRMALSELYQWSARQGIPVYPWLGAGSLPFRGHLRPDRVKEFLQTYPGVRSVTIQSAFRYDFPLATVKRGIHELNTKLSTTDPVIISPKEFAILKRVNIAFERTYQETIGTIADTIIDVAAAVPSRRERRLHIGLLGYGRTVGKNKKKFPRAITFTAALYSLGIPPEMIGTGRALQSLSAQELATLEKHYPTFAYDLSAAAQYVNKENLAFLIQKESVWRAIAEDIAMIETYIGKPVGPTTPESYIHRNWTSTLFFQKRKPAQMTTAIIESAKIRCSLG
ncbi:MAG: phosphoenolpyruvate carboxylase [Candidatus Kerfeldbacteria bacterium]|nr:phosphoenolpyruvate carboxylase [Candidatus Kerfeldbacteria bacterium]